MSYVKELIKGTTFYKVYHQNKVKKLKEINDIRNRNFLKEGEELLHVFSEAMNNSNILFWLEFGSLLGYYRDHDFIQHDCDLDFGVFLKDQSRVKEVLNKVGFKLIHQYLAEDGGIEECYKYKNTTIDIFYFREDENYYYCNTFVLRSYSRRVNKLICRNACLVKRINIPKQSFIKVSFKNSDVYIPKDCCLHLEMHYGKLFMTPNPNFDYKKEATNITYYTYEQCKGKLFVYGKKF